MARGVNPLNFVATLQSMSGTDYLLVPERAEKDQFHNIFVDWGVMVK